MDYTLVQVHYYETHGNLYAEAGATIEDRHGNQYEADATLVYEGDWILHEVVSLYDKEGNSIPA